MTIDHDLLMAFADGELDEVTRARVERAVAEDPELRARLEVQQRLRARLAAHYAPVLDEDVPESLRAAVATNVVPLRAPPAPSRMPAWRTFAALAATLVLGLFLGRTLPMGGGAGPVVSANGVLVASGDLAATLDTQLASAQAPNSATRIGITFRDGNGRVCRTFDGASLAGLACRDGANWRLEATGAGSAASGSDYRQAASGNPRILEAAQDMMAGAPLDAAAEQQARAAGWRTVR